MAKNFYFVLIAGLLILPVDALSQSKPLTKAEITRLISGKTEVGRVVRPSGGDIGPKGTRYTIRYAANGTFRYSAGSRSGRGQWNIRDNALCRGFDGGRTSCRKIQRSGNGYVGVGFRSGSRRYTFQIR
ncbi:MAG: hypothetical protein AAGJ94_06525 [Pseudomonadota bacterium]